jgi:hypothetical protein
VLADLVIARIVEPTSLLDAARVLSDLGQPPASYATVKRTLKRVAVPGESSGALTYCEQVARRCFEHARSHGDVSSALYDVTTLYFEAEKEDDLRKGRPTQGTTYARDDLRKGRPTQGRVLQGASGRSAGRGGSARQPGRVPPEIGCFAGNKAETATVIPALKAFQARHQLADMVVVADAGCCQRRTCASSTKPAAVHRRLAGNEGPG